MNKIIQFNSESRDNLKIGIDTLANAVKVTLGPKGRNVIIDKNYGGPHVTKDGVSVAKEVILKDPVQNLGAELIREAASKTCNDVGDGTTSATLLAQSIINDGVKYLAAGANPIDIKRGIDKAVKEVVSYIKEHSIAVGDSYEQIEDIATISANNDREIGALVATAIKEVKSTGVVTVDSSKNSDTYVEIVKGMRIDNGYLSPYMASNQETMTSELIDPCILLVDRTISTLNDLLLILDHCAKSSKPLLIIANDISSDALTTVVSNVVQGRLNIVIVKSPCFGNYRSNLLEDIAVVTGATVCKTNVNGEMYPVEVLGTSEKAVITRDNTTIINGKGSIEAIHERVQAIQGTEDADERIAHLTSGVAVIYVGAPSEVEMKEKKDRVDDAVCATKAALEEGIVPGGGEMYLRAYKALNIKGDNDDENMGINIIRMALRKPLYQIASNAGKDGSVIVDKVCEGNLGYNAHTDTYENLLEVGVVDPAKVSRVALENAASIAGMFLTTECVIANDYGQNT